MARPVTADEFVSGIVAAIAINGPGTFDLGSGDADRRFSNAFLEFQLEAGNHGLRLDFSLLCDPYHGDSACLREALMTAAEKELVSFDGLMRNVIEVTVPLDRAERILARSPVPRNRLESLAGAHFQPTLPMSALPR